MNSKLILCANDISDLNFINDYYGVYVENGNSFPLESLPCTKPLFINVCALTPNKIIEIARFFLDKNVTFTVKDITQAVFIKSVNQTAKISLYVESFSINDIPFITANGFSVTCKYTTLAPERINAYHQAGATVLGAVLTRKDEVGVLEFWNTDYIAVKHPLI